MKVGPFKICRCKNALVQTLCAGTSLRLEMSWQRKPGAVLVHGKKRAGAGRQTWCGNGSRLDMSLYREMKTLNNPESRVTTLRPSSLNSRGATRLIKHAVVDAAMRAHSTQAAEYIGLSQTATGHTLTVHTHTRTLYTCIHIEGKFFNIEISATVPGACGGNEVEC